MKKANKIVTILIFIMLVVSGSILLSDHMNNKRQQESNNNELIEKEKEVEKKNVEKKDVFKEDTTVNMNGKNMQAYIRGSGDYTFVLLPGFVTESPMNNFQLLSDELSKTHRVVVIDPLGYGLSDDTEEPRTVENMVSEIHSVLDSLNIKKYALVAHSIWGVYALDYMNTYPQEVSMHIGIDSTLPAWGGAEEGLEYAEKASLQIKGDSDKFPTNAMINEGKEMQNNFDKTMELRYPTDIPVMYLLADESIKSNYFWFSVHEDMLVDVDQSRIEVLRGSHFLHLTDAPEISEKIDRLIADLNK